MNNLVGKNNWKMMLVVWVSVLGLVTGVQIVQKNLDDRSKAAEENVGQTVDSEVSSGSVNPCGGSDMALVGARPIADLCNEGSPVWTDSVGEDGEFNWTCVDDEGTIVGDCGAILEE
jgi:hypothetical protein